jgi:hypothetical protein
VRNIDKGGAKLDYDVTQISGKLHPLKDRDLILAISKIHKRDRSRIYREALRMYFKTEGDFN